MKSSTLAFTGNGSSTGTAASVGGPGFNLAETSVYRDNPDASQPQGGVQNRGRPGYNDSGAVDFDASARIERSRSTAGYRQFHLPDRPTMPPEACEEEFQRRVNRGSFSARHPKGHHYNTHPSDHDAEKLVTGGFPLYDLSHRFATKFTRVLSPDSQVLVKAAGVSTDFDETTAKGTARHIHDGAEGRQAKGFLKVCQRYFGDQNVQFLEAQNFVRWWNSEGISCLGNSEEKNARLLLAAVTTKLGISLEGQDFENVFNDLSANIGSAFARNFYTMIQNVSVMKGVERLFIEARKEEIPLVLCTASGQKVILPTLAALSLQHHFRNPDENGKLQVITGATKKDGNVYRGEDVKRACALIETHPARCAMLGDTMSDIAAAGLAGIHVVVIRPSLLDETNHRIGRPHTFEEACDIMERKFQDVARIHPELLQNCHIILVPCFSQVAVSKALKGPATATIIENARESADEQTAFN